MQATATSRAIPSFRFCLCLLAILNWYIGYTEPASMMAQVAAIEHGRWILFSMFAFGLVGCLDVLINDVLPARFQWQMASNQRHFMLMAICFTYLSSLFVVNQHINSAGLVLYFLWNIGAIVTCTFVDARYRRKVAESCRTMHKA